MYLTVHNGEVYYKHMGMLFPIGGTFADKIERHYTRQPICSWKPECDTSGCPGPHLVDCERKPKPEETKLVRKMYLKRDR